MLCGVECDGFTNRVVFCDLPIDRYRQRVRPLTCGRAVGHRWTPARSLPSHSSIHESERLCISRYFFVCDGIPSDPQLDSQYVEHEGTTPTYLKSK